MNLLLLSGRRRRRGWTTLDGDPDAEPDILARVPPLPAEVYQCEQIEIAHGIEHFYRWEAEQLLAECHRVLIPGGRIVLEQPNIEYAAEILLGHREPPDEPWERFAMWPLYGDPQNGPDFAHRWGWTPRTLTAALHQAGFRSVRQAPALHHCPGRDFRMVASR